MNDLEKMVETAKADLDTIRARLWATIGQHTYVTDEWGGSKLAGWRWGSNVVVGGIDEAADAIVAENITDLLDLVDFLRRQADVHCAKIAQLDEENQRLQAELAAERQEVERQRTINKTIARNVLVGAKAGYEERLQAERQRREALEKALPDAGLLERAAGYARNTTCKGCPLRTVPCGRDCSLVGAPLRAAAARIREVQEAGGG